MSNQNIFISYRRGDTSGHAGRIYDRLNARFPGHVFMDVTSINLGADFVVEIENQVGGCEVFIALIGDEWATATDHAGRRRLDNPNDFVRLEVVTSLRRGITVIPVLVNGATMPEPSTLPEDLAPLTRRNALEITETDFDHDVKRLIGSLETVFAKTMSAAHPVTVEPDTGNGPHRRLPWLVALGVVGLFIVVAIGLFVGWSKLRQNPDTGRGTAPATAQTSPETVSSANPGSLNSANTNTPTPSPVADELHTPPKDSTERRAITDALRDEFSNFQSTHYLPDKGRLVFMLYSLKVHNGWAWTFAEPRSEANPGASFRESRAFLLHQDGGNWRVVKLPLGVEDPNDPEGLDYPHPRDIEKIRQMYPAMPVDILKK